MVSDSYLGRPRWYPTRRHRGPAPTSGGVAVVGVAGAAGASLPAAESASRGARAMVELLTIDTQRYNVSALRHQVTGRAGRGGAGRGEVGWAKQFTEMQEQCHLSANRLVAYDRLT